jgi:hypothetical protein
MTFAFAGNPGGATCHFWVSPGTHEAPKCCAPTGVAWPAAPVSPNRIVDLERRVLIVLPIYAFP